MRWPGKHVLFLAQDGDSENASVDPAAKGQALDMVVAGRLLNISETTCVGLGFPVLKAFPECGQPPNL